MNSEVEIWRDIKGYEGLYQVSNIGRIKSLYGWNGKNHIKRERILNPYKRKDKRTTYPRSVIKLVKGDIKKEYKVHRLVAEAFISNPEKKTQVNHIDGNPLNNNASNLEWTTDRENKIHAIENNLKINTINTIDRETMLELLNNGKSYDEIAKLLGIAKGTVFNYIRKFQIKKIYV